MLKYLLTSVLTILLTSVSSQADEAMQDIMAPEPVQSVSVSKPINYFTKRLQTKKTSPGDAEALKLSKVAQDVFEIKEFTVPANLKTEKEKMAAVTPEYVTEQIKYSIEKKSWDEPVSSAKIEKIKADSSLLKKYLGETSYSASWINYQIGQKDEAKKNLSAMFEASYTEVMNLKETHNSYVSPLVESERIIRILKPLSTEKENKAREEQMKKMKTHVSTLPDISIMT